MSRLPPYPSNDLRQWALQLVQYLQDVSPSRGQVLPRPVLLEHQTNPTLEKAFTDGVLMYDPVREAPVYSVNNEWRSAMTVSIVDIIEGKVAGHSIMSAMGERESMGTPLNGEDIWRGNELSPSPTDDEVIPAPSESGEQMSVVSEAAADNATGAGAREVTIAYIDAAGDAQTTTVAMNGTTPVNLTPSDVRFVNDMYVTDVGSAGVAANHIKIHNTADAGLVYNMIHQGDNKSLVPHRMVPAGHSLALRGWTASEAQGKRVAFRLRSTDMDGDLKSGVFIFKGTVYLNKEAASGLIATALVPALSVVKVSGWPDVAGGEGSCSWWGVLVEDGF